MNREDLRSEVRKAASKGASIEFKPAADAMPYHFKLRDISASGLGILANKNSDIFRHISPGDVFHMKYHQGDASLSPEHLRVEIRHISEPASGKPAGHMIIGLYILERLIEADAPGTGMW